MLGAKRFPQQLPAGPRERQVTKLVEHDHVEPGELTATVPALPIRASSSSRFTVFIDYQDWRDGNGRQLPIRNSLEEAGRRSKRTTTGVIAHEPTIASNQ